LSIIRDYWRIKSITCPRCGKKGILTQKTTISKRKYKYKKWYVYHDERPFPKKQKIRKQRWCYLNKNHLKSTLIHEKILNLTKLTEHVQQLSDDEWRKEVELFSPTTKIVICPDCGKKFNFPIYDPLPRKIVCNKKSHAFIYQ
jgi:predicted RNA-binding Zn-ribbon protein involved in translation (DUF1610 family)